MSQVKENAPELLRRTLSRVPVDVVATGDYQPAEKKFEVSQRMLEVCLELGFPVSILERSPLVLHDPDLIEGVVAMSGWAPRRIKILARAGPQSSARVDRGL